MRFSTNREERVASNGFFVMTENMRKFFMYNFYLNSFLIYATDGSV